jgi:dienelactone hydrolase
MGGQAVLELARDGAVLKAVASFHGLLDTDKPAEQPIPARILVCHGDADTLVPRTQVMAFWEEMDAVAANWHFHSYAGVAHGFTNPSMLDGTANPAYDASADRQSWAAMLGLFDEILGT